MRLLLVLAAVSSACRAPSTPDHAAMVAVADLRYERQVPRPEAGLPIGNGTTGSLVWTEPDRLRLQVNRVDVFARDASAMIGEACDWAGGCAFVDVITGPGTLPSDDVEQRLAVHEALATVRGQGVSARLFVWSERDVLVVEVEDERATPQPITLELRSLRPPVVVDEDMEARSTLRREGERLWLEQRFTGLAHHCRSAVAAQVLGAEATARQVSETAWRLTVPPTRGKVVFLIASAAALEPEADVAGAARAALDAAVERGSAGVLAEHRAYWSDFWSRSYLRAHSADGDADLLQEHWAWTLYVMGSSSRGGFPPKFNGMLWSTDGDTRRWGSQYWWWNTQLLYRPLLAAAHPELTRPLHALYGGMLDEARVAARQQWGSGGIFLGETTDHDGPEALPEDIALELRELLLARKPFEDTSAAFQEYARARNGYNARWNWLHHESTAPFSWVTHIVFSGAQVAWHHWLYYEYTLDEGFLRERGYPLLRGMAEFYRQFPNLVREADGRHHLHHLNDQELLWGTRDPHNELWAMRGMLHAALEASRVLGVDDELRPRWEELLVSLADAPRSTDPDVVPGSAHPHPSGRPVWALGRLPCRKVEALTSDTIVRPCVDYDLWSLESEDAAMTRIALDSYEADPMRREALTEGHGYALSELPLAAAAMGRAEDVRVILPGHLRRGLLPNRLSLEDGEQAQTIEPIATVATATQWALLQSKPARPGGAPIIRVFPAWPPEWDASFQLAARRGFLVRSEMEGGRIPFVEIRSRLGGRCVVRTPWGGRDVLVRRDGREVGVVEGGRASFETTPGEVLLLVPR